MYSYLEDIDRSSVGLQQVQTQKNNMNKIEISRVKFTFYMTTPPPPPAPPPSSYLCHSMYHVISPLSSISGVSNVEPFYSWARCSVTLQPYFDQVVLCS